MSLFDIIIYSLSNEEMSNKEKEEALEFYRIYASACNEQLEDISVEVLPK